MIISCHSGARVTNRADQPLIRTERFGYSSGRACASRNVRGVGHIDLQIETAARHKRAQEPDQGHQTVLPGESAGVQLQVQRRAAGELAEIRLGERADQRRRAASVRPRGRGQVRSEDITSSRPERSGGAPRAELQFPAEGADAGRHEHAIAFGARGTESGVVVENAAQHGVGRLAVVAIQNQIAGDLLPKFLVSLPVATQDVHQLRQGDSLLLVDQDTDRVEGVGRVGHTAGVGRTHGVARAAVVIGTGALDAVIHEQRKQRRRRAARERLPALLPDPVEQSGHLRVEAGVDGLEVRIVRQLPIAFHAKGALNGRKEIEGAIPKGRAAGNQHLPAAIVREVAAPRPRGSRSRPGPESPPRHCRWRRCRLPGAALRRCVAKACRACGDPRERPRENR